MDSSQKVALELRAKRKLRVRKRVRGSSDKPRLSIFKSNMHLYVQLIDDEQGVTLGATSTISKEFKGTDIAKKGNESAVVLGKKIAEIAQSKGVTRVVLDRGSCKYHGLIKTLADAAREAGLSF